MPPLPGKGFGRHGVQLKAYALGSSEAVAAVSLLFSVFSGAGLVNKVALSAGETDQPFALRLEIDGAGRGDCTEDETGSQEKSQTFFHEKYLSEKKSIDVASCCIFIVAVEIMVI